MLKTTTKPCKMKQRRNQKEKAKKQGLNTKMLFSNMWMWWRTDCRRSIQVLSLRHFAVQRLKYLSSFSSPLASTVASFCSSLSAEGEEIFLARCTIPCFPLRLWQDEEKLDVEGRLLQGDEALRDLEERARIWKEPRTVWIIFPDLIYFLNYIFVCWAYFAINWRWIQRYCACWLVFVS